MIGHALIGKIINRHAVTVTAAAGQWRVARGRSRQRFLDIPGGEQIALAIGTPRTRAMAVAPDIEVPIGDVTVGRQGRTCFYHHRGTEGLPLKFLVAHPLQADGASRHRACDHRRIGRDKIGRVLTVAACALHVMQHDIFFRHAQRRCQFHAQRVNTLAVRPHGIFAVVATRHRARRRKRCMGEKLARVFGAEFLALICVHWGRAFFLADDLGFRRAAQQIAWVEFRQLRDFLPFGVACQPLLRAYRLLFTLRHHREKAPIAHHRHHARHLFHIIQIDA